MEEKRDPRFRKLSVGGVFVNLIALVFALAAITSNHWGTLSGPIRGYFGPFMVCQDISEGVDRCERGGLGPYRQSFAAYLAGTGAILCVLGLAVGVILGPLVVAMHHAKHQICLKFRHAVFLRLIVTSGAAFCSFVAFICFLLEAKIFVRMQSDESADLSWSFYLEILAFLLSAVVGVAASYEWRWSRKLGGDPTVYSRDPEGVKAETIINQNFREAPRTGPSSIPKGANMQPPKATGVNGRGGGVERNRNGIAMTKMSGLPYSITANGSAHVKKPRFNGHNHNGNQAPVVAFDPKKTPLRSSLRRPKNSPASYPGPGEDGIDQSISQVLTNPAYVHSSPPMKKKVRIHTQSTAV